MTLAEFAENELAYDSQLREAGFQERAKGSVLYLRQDDFEFRFLRQKGNLFRYAGKFTVHCETHREFDEIVDEIEREVKR